MAACRPWSRYQVARALLAARGHLPWRLMTFLQDAYACGLLRQMGAVYQFRHARLQDRLVGLAMVAGTARPEPVDTVAGR